MEALQLDARPLTFAMAKAFAAVLGRKSYLAGPGRTVRLTDIPEPGLPGQDWVIIRTIYCGFCGSDLNLILLHDSPSAQPFTSFPCILGHEFIGDIVNAGSSVRGFSIGDRVAVNPVLGCEARGISPVCPECNRGEMSHCRNHAEGPLSPGMFIGLIRDLNGGFASHVAVHQSQLFPVQHGLSNESAVMTEPVSVALKAVFENKPEDSEKVLVIGGGVIGNLIVQSIRALGIGCSVYVAEPSGFAGENARKAGADEVFHPKDVLKRTRGVTGANIYKPIIGKPMPRGGFDRIFDTVGNSASLNTGLRVLEFKGTLSLVGIGSVLRIDPTPLWLKLQRIQGVYGHGVVNRNGKAVHTFSLAMSLMDQGKIRAEELITHRFRLKDYRKMIEVNMNKGKYKAMKSIVVFDE